MTSTKKKRILLIGNGMTGYKFCELLVNSRGSEDVLLTVMGEEPRPAYDRVHLTEYFSHPDAEPLTLAPRSWYKKAGITLLTDTRVVAIDRQQRTVTTHKGKSLGYDTLVLATGSAPFVPPIPGLKGSNVFVYRTIEDLDAIRKRARTATRAAVMGGGLLGLEAARALSELGLETRVIEYGSRLMGRQLDPVGSQLLQREITRLGIKVHLDAYTEGMHLTENGVQLSFAGRDPIPVDFVVVSAGIRPRDELAAEAGLPLGKRGGITVDDSMRTTDSSIYAIGECAAHKDMVYGLVAPCYQMADAAVSNILGHGHGFSGSDLSTKLKLMGVEVATVGDSAASPEDEQLRAVIVNDEIAGTYKKMLIDRQSGCLTGAILVGDTSDYNRLVQIYRSGEPMPSDPVSIIVQSGTTLQYSGSNDAPSALICTCNNVTRGDLNAAIAGGVHAFDELVKCTGAGTGCGGCKPQVAEIVSVELRKLGEQVSHKICDHFPMSRSDIFALVAIKDLHDFASV